MAALHQIYLETGQKKTFAGAMDWPGWCRSGKDENGALAALMDYRTRYQKILKMCNFSFEPPSDLSELVVVERWKGNATTDFGSPFIILKFDQKPTDPLVYERWRKILAACWQAFDQTRINAVGKELKKGPRGGSRDLNKMIQHLLEADQHYLKRLAWKHPLDPAQEDTDALKDIRRGILAGLTIAEQGDLPPEGLKGGQIWPPSYFVRRVAWHLLDHLWEIEDRLVLSV
ncbi:MAG: hypothetical protein E4H33_05265 [Anaerolineales bacterium]|nr:MAG: hypothetical protein E4H33_05265 [Anaerolineales bacterium]